MTFRSDPSGPVTVVGVVAAGAFGAFGLQAAVIIKAHAAIPITKVGDVLYIK
ncbi:MAG: hypothetical protein AB7Q29_19230 [Vicinamibacterales bacterium]